MERTVKACIEDCLYFSPSKGQNVLPSLPLILVHLTLGILHIKGTLVRILAFSSLWFVCLFLRKYVYRQLENQFKQDIFESQMPCLQPTVTPSLCGLGLGSGMRTSAL